MAAGSFGNRAAIVAGTLLLLLSCSGSRGHGQNPDPGIPTKSLRAALLALARRADPEVETAQVRTQLDVYEIELRERLEGLQSAERKATALSRYFFKEQLFTADDDLSNPDNFYVDRVLTSRQGYCLSLSSVILAVGRRLRLPLHGVAAPRHFFVRWDDGETRINIETTEKGRERSDAFYRKRGIVPLAEKEGVFLRNLTDAEVVGYLLNNEGFIHWCAGDVAKAEKRFRKAVALCPRMAEGYINLGVVAGERGEDKKASSLFARVLKWIPGDSMTYFNRSLVALRSGKYREALKDLDRAATADPRSRHLLHYREFVLATILRPANWRRYQDQVVREGEGLRSAGKLARGFHGTYFSRPDLSGTSATRVDRALEFEWRWSRPHRRIPADNFSVRWRGFVDIPSDGTYTFYTVSNDGVRVWVDGVRIIDDWERQEGALNQESLRLKKGLHRVRVEYFEYVRFAGITFRVKRSDKNRPLPPSTYHHER